MKRAATFIFIVTVLILTQTFGQYPPFTKWYQNPLGFKPVSLHTANGIIIPAVAATAILLLTKNDKTSADRYSYYGDFGFSYGYYASKTTVFKTISDYFIRQKNV